MQKPSGFPPQVFIIGAQKAGTTQLATLLDQHPDICLSSPKEPDYFTRFFSKGNEWYQERFENLDKCLIDASTSYTCSPLPECHEHDVEEEGNPMVGVPQRIFEYAPQAKFIYLLRDPAKRVYSAYWHQVRAGLETESLEKALSRNSYYLRVSQYSEQLERFLNTFPATQFLLLDFEELIAKPDTTVANCLDFIGLPPLEKLDTGIHKNKSFQYAGPLNTLNVMLGNRGGIGTISKSIKRFLPQGLVDLLKSKLSKPVPKMTQEEERLICSFLDNEVGRAKMLLSERNGIKNES